MKPKAINMISAEVGIKLVSTKCNFAGARINGEDVFNSQLSKFFISNLINYKDYIFLFIFVEQFTSKSDSLFNTGCNITMSRFNKEVEKVMKKEAVKAMNCYENKGKMFSKFQKKFKKTGKELIQEWLGKGYIYQTAYSADRFVVNPFILNTQTEGHQRENLLNFFSKIYNNKEVNDYINSKDVYFFVNKFDNQDLRNKINGNYINNIFSWDDVCGKMQKLERINFNYGDNSK